jgi:replicative DNA helicase
VLDDLVPTGPSPGTGGLVVASSGAGKSSFVLDLIDKLVEIDVPCFYFSLEMGKMDTMDRWMAMRTGVPFASFVDPKPEEWVSLQSLVKKERDFLEKKKYFRFCESATMSINDCRREITKFKKEAGIDYAVVVFDLLSMLRDFNGFYEGTNFAQVAEVSINKLNAVAKELNVSWVGVLQMNRSVEDTKVLDWKDCEKMRPQRNQIKNSNAYLERARWVVTLFRPLYYAKMYLKPEQYVDHDEDVIEVNLVKANNADVQSREMYFDGATFQLTAK